MSLAIVTNKLLDFAKAAAARAKSANDPDTIARFSSTEQEFRALAKMAHDALQSNSGSGSVWSGTVSPGGVRQGLVRLGRAGGGRSAMGALQFWALHGQAVQNIIATHGLNWKVRAPFGETLLVTIPSKYRKAVTARGTTLKWAADHRMPAASYWPDQALPLGLAITADYARSTGRAKDEQHDDSWHRAHGYVRYFGEWVSELGLRAAQAHADAIEDNRLRAKQAAVDKAAAEDAEVDAEYAEAAD